ncbi:MAG: TonB-dependent receptor, partial [bacterium]
MTFSRPLCKAIGTALLIALPLSAFAGTTGKIAGRITDASTGEPLSLVNVVVDGTTRGAATDLDGYYFIINLSPGTYTLNVSALGYKAQIITGIDVSVDKTSNVDVELESEVIQGEAVTVVAQRPAVEKDRTFATATVGDQDLQVMPVNAISEVVNIQAGVVDGHFRGGRGGEVVYMIDGIPVQDVYDNSQATGIDQEVVKELQVITGTFNAEYGQAMSGVVNMVTKDGGDRYSGMAGAQFGDYYSDHKNQFDYIDNINPNAINNYQFSLSGPV